MSNILKRAAIQYAKKGIPVFPCKLDKTPYTKNGFKDATLDLVKVEKFWNDHPKASIGMPTGKISGMWIFDIDAPEGYETLKKLESKYGKLPDTLIQKTGGGGLHYFFKAENNGTAVKNTSSKIGKKIDSRGEGGYVLLSPSNHPSGNKYEWQTKNKVIAAPKWLIDLLIKQEPNRIAHHVHGQNSPYGLTALSNQIIKLSSCSEGQRNEQLNISAYTLGRLIAGGELELSHVENSLLGIALALGLSRSEAEKTLQSGIKAGLSKPKIAPTTEDLNYYFTEQNEQNEQSKQKSAKISNYEQKSADEQVKIKQVPNNIAGHIKEFIENSKGSFSVRDIDNEFGLKTRQEKNARSQALYIWLNKKIIKRDKLVAGKYHIIDNEIDFIDYDAPAEEQFPITLPFNLHKYIHICPKSIIVFAGSTNAGKTSILLNILKLNRHQDYKLMYLMSEMGNGEYIRKIKGFGEPLNKWKKVMAASKSYDFQGAIQNHNPNGITCIDYLESVNGEFHRMGSQIRDIYDSLDDGLAIIAIQKHSQQNVGRGGELTMEKARLYCTVDFLTSDDYSVTCAVQITKLKNFIGKNLQGNELHFRIHGKNEMQVLMDWTPSNRVDRNKCVIEYDRGGKKLPDSSEDTLEPIYFLTDAGKKHRIRENTIVEWGAVYTNIDPYQELIRLSKQHNFKLKENGWFFQLNGIIRKINEQRS